MQDLILADAQCLRTGAQSVTFLRMAEQELRTSAPGEIRLLSIPEVAERLACSRRHVYDLIKRGDLPKIDIGRARIGADDLARYVELRRRIGAA